MHCRDHITGFTLLEFMISMTLGFILLSGAFTLLVEAMKNSEAVMQAQQKQNDVMRSIQWLVNDIERADAFGCSRACVEGLHLQRMHGDVSQLMVAYQGQPQLALTKISEDHLHVAFAQHHQFNKNTALLITQPDEATMVLVHSENQSQLTLDNPLSLKSSTGAMVGPYVVKHYFYDPHQKKLIMKTERGELITLLDGVSALSFYYDVKTPTGVLEKLPDTDDAWDNVCGVNIRLTVSGQTWVRYAPVLSHCL